MGDVPDGPRPVLWNELVDTDHHRNGQGVTAQGWLRTPDDADSRLLAIDSPQPVKA